MKRVVPSILGILAVALTACGSEPAEQWPPVKVYTVRGEVASLPEPGPYARIGIRHEAIPDFIGVLGEPEPMKPMTMPFAIGEGVDSSSLAVGDKIEFQLEVDWSADDRARVIAFETLAPETELDFSAP